MIRKTTDKSRGIRLATSVQIRAIVDEELEQVRPAKKGGEALDSAVQCGKRTAGALRESQQIKPDAIWPPKTRRLPFRLIALALLAPQVAVIAVFFFWPAGQALLQSFQQSDAFGTSTEWSA